MKKRLILLVVVAVAALAWGVPTASAQLAAVSDAKTNAPGVVYRLNANSAWLQGCWAPCACPIQIADSIVGTFILTKQFEFGTVTVYRVSDVNWYVDVGLEERQMTGSGVYTRISGVAGWLHRLQLDLSTDGGSPEHFDSGLVNGGGDFPDITGLTISTNNLVCYGTAVEVDASPVPNSELRCYRLKDGSTYQEGCLPPCLCPILAELPLAGGFALVELSDSGTVIEYAVIRVRWDVVAPSPEPLPSSKFRGFGRYTRISGVAGWADRMELLLSVDNEPLTNFDSGINNVTVDFPMINVAVAQNGFYCYDIVLRINASPCAALTPSGGDG